MITYLCILFSKKKYFLQNNRKYYRMLLITIYKLANNIEDI